MNQHHRGPSAEEVVMVFTLLLSTTLIVLSPYVRLPPSAGAPAIAVRFAEAPRGEAAMSDGDGVDGDSALPRSDGESTPKPDGDFVLLTAAGNQAFDGEFARAQLARAGADDSSGRAGALRVPKNLYIGGRRAGQIEIIVSPAGDLLVQGSELQALLAGADRAGEAMLVNGLGDGRLRLRDLREAGIDLRYSPDDDTFKLVG